MNNRFVEDEKCRRIIMQPFLRGTWRKVSDIFVCNKCNRCSNWKYNFCPNCGADMRENE